MASSSSLTDRRLILMPKPPTSSLLNSIFSNSLNKASRMLISVASSEDFSSGEEQQSWRAMDHVRHVLMLTVWANVWVLRTITEAFPSPKSFNLSEFNIEGLVSRKEESGDSNPLAVTVHGGPRVASGMEVVQATETAIGRTLSHVLEILNQIPTTSRKYEYVLATADRILSENLQNGHPSLLYVSRSALATAFSRTSELLRRSLRSPDRSIFSSTSTPWHSKVLRLLPPGPRRLYDGFRLCINGFLPSADNNFQQPNYKPHRHTTITGPGLGSFEWAEAEKLANELLWIMNKLRACGGACEAIVRWAFASNLASLALTAHPRVQAPIVKITVSLIRELEHGEWQAAHEVRFGMIALWLPVLCYASNGVTSPVVSGPERYETERALEDLISGLPHEDQEVILGNWMEDFAASDSDWPNLSRCFDKFCRVSRKQVLLLE